MKKGIHPRYLDQTIVMTDGSTFIVKSSHKKPLLKLDVDTKTHMAWSGKNTTSTLEASGQLARFKKRFKMSYVKNN